MRARLLILIAVPTFVLAMVIWHLSSSRPARAPAPSAPSPAAAAIAIVTPAATTPATADSAPTAVYAHNLMLRKGPDFRIYVRWLRGNMVRTRHDVNPTFDDPETFFMEIKAGVIRANIG